MKKQALNNSSIVNNNKEQFTEDRRKLRSKKINRYIYTEADLGEGMLYAGMISSYIAGKLQNLNPLKNYNRPYSFS